MNTEHVSHSSWWMKTFLVAYAMLLCGHLLGGVDISLSSLSVLCAGIAIALFAHTKHGAVPSLFLVVHIAIEWYVHARHGSHYKATEVFIHGTHALFDILFLFFEARHHWGKRWKVCLSVFAVSIAACTWLLYVPKVKSFAQHLSSASLHVHSASLEQIFVLGGILGCVLMHLFFKRSHGRVEKDARTH